MWSGTNAASRRSPSLAALFTAVFAAPLASAVGPPVYPATPDWVSGNPHYSTGAALVDLDRDGWLDLVVSDGNDIQRGRLNVYYNDGAGSLPVVADAQSSDTAHNGHLDVADVNGDGWPDVAVAQLGTGNVHESIARVYLNNAGVLSALPDWTAEINGNAFSVAFGDVNLDGRPDLAVGTGWPYPPAIAYPNYVYLNVDGALEPTASWVSSDSNHYMGVLWVDADADGWLDLVAIGRGSETQLYRNLGGALETTASWSTTDSGGQYGIMVAAGDVNGDRRVDLIATDNTQLSGGDGLFKQYLGVGAAFFETEHSWSYYDGYGSAVALADVDNDGRLDLATGAWWDHTRVFFNTGTGFSDILKWSSGGTSVVEKIVFGDVDPACGGERVGFARFAAQGDLRLFHLPHAPIQGIVRVRRDGVDLGPGGYTFSRERGWLTVDAPPAQKLEVTYAVSGSLDMAISNWDGDIGNYLYYSLRFDDCNGNEVPDWCEIASGAVLDRNDNGVPDECECAGDTDGSMVVDFGDLLAVLAVWGPCPACPEDFDGSGAADFGDLLVVLGGWGVCEE